MSVWIAGFDEEETFGVSSSTCPGNRSQGSRRVISLALSRCHRRRLPISKSQRRKLTKRGRRKSHVHSPPNRRDSTKSILNRKCLSIQPHRRNHLLLVLESSYRGGYQACITATPPVEWSVMVRGDTLYSASAVVCVDYAAVCEETGRTKCKEGLVALVTGIKYRVCGDGAA